jgi:hypothetical protein
MRTAVVALALVVALGVMVGSATATPLASATKAATGTYGYCAHCFLLKAGARICTTVPCR